MRSQEIKVGMVLSDGFTVTEIAYQGTTIIVTGTFTLRNGKLSKRKRYYRAGEEV